MKYPTLMLCIQRGFPASPAVASLYNNNSVLHSVHRQTPASRRLNSPNTLGYRVSLSLECQRTRQFYHKPCPCSHPDFDSRGYKAGLPARLVNFNILSSKRIVLKVVRYCLFKFQGICMAFLTLERYTKRRFFMAISFEDHTSLAREQLY